MIFQYCNLGGSEIQGSSQAEILVGLEAELSVVHQSNLLYREPSFPIAELARDLGLWAAEEDRGDFRFESMSFEEIGLVTFSRIDSQTWRFSSCSNPELVSDPIEWKSINRAIDSLVAEVRMDLVRLGFEPNSVFPQHLCE